MKLAKHLTGLFPPLDQIRSAEAQTEESIARATRMIENYAKVANPSAQVAIEYQARRIDALEVRLVRLQDMRSTWFWLVAGTLLGGFIFILAGFALTIFLMSEVWLPPYRLIKLIIFAVLTVLAAIVQEFYKWASYDLVGKQVLEFLFEDCDYIQNQPAVSYGKWERGTIR